MPRVLLLLGIAALCALPASGAQRYHLSRTQWFRPQSPLPRARGEGTVGRMGAFCLELKELTFNVSEEEEKDALELGPLYMKAPLLDRVLTAK